MQKARQTGCISRSALRQSARLCSLASVLAAALLSGCSLEASEASMKQDEPAQRSAAASLHAVAQGDIEVDYSSQGNVVTVGGSLSNPVSLERLLEDPYGAAEAFFREHAEAFGAKESMAFVPDRTKMMIFPMSDDLIVRLWQTHAGVRVEAWAAVRYAKDGSIMQATFAFDRNIQIESVEPKVNADKARRLAERHVKSRRYVHGDRARPRGEPELVIYPASRHRSFLANEDSDLLVWVLVVSEGVVPGPVKVILDANSGKLLDIFDHGWALSNRMTFNLEKFGYKNLSDVNWNDPAMNESGEQRECDRKKRPWCISTEEVRNLHSQVKESYDYFAKNSSWRSFDGYDAIPLQSGAHYQTVFYEQSANITAVLSTNPELMVEV